MTADLVVSESVPVEDLVDPDVPSPPVWDINLHELTDPQLRDFLLKPQGGARQIARRIFRLVADHRRGAFSAASAELLHVPGAPIFPDVPEDRGHFPGPYYRHVLQGLRSSPPDYVETLRRPPTSDEPWDVPQIPNGNIGRIVVAGGTPAGASASAGTARQQHRGRRPDHAVRSPGATPSLRVAQAVGMISDLIPNDELRAGAGFRTRPGAN